MTILSLVLFCFFPCTVGIDVKKRLMRTQTRPMIYPNPNPPIPQPGPKFACRFRGEMIAKDGFSAHMCKKQKDRIKGGLSWGHALKIRPSPISHPSPMPKPHYASPASLHQAASLTWLMVNLLSTSRSSICFISSMLAADMIHGMRNS